MFVIRLLVCHISLKIELINKNIFRHKNFHSSYSKDTSFELHVLINIFE